MAKWCELGITWVVLMLMEESEVQVKEDFLEGPLAWRRSIDG